MRKQRGFTLVEIIVVLVILAIIAAFTIPAMLGFIQTAHEKECISIRGTLSRGYTAEYVASHPDGDAIGIDAATTLLQSAAKKSYGDSTTLSNLCPDGGTYTVQSADKAHIVIICSKHDTQAGSSDYDETKAYTNGDIVVIKHIRYRCIIAAKGKSPETDNNYWYVIGTDNGSTPIYTRYAHYEIGVVVKSGDAYYKAISNPAMGTPAENKYWTKVSN